MIVELIFMATEMTAELAAEQSFNPAESSWMNWAQVIVSIIGFVVLGLQIGDFKGQQTVKNVTYEKDIQANKDDINSLKSDIVDIKVGIADILGQLKGTDHIKS